VIAHEWQGRMARVWHAHGYGGDGPTCAFWYAIATNLQHSLRSPLTHQRRSSSFVQTLVRWFGQGVGIRRGSIQFVLLGFT
jgi:hypothetical protein